MSKHTPGPWNRGRFQSYFADTGAPVRYVYRPNDAENDTRIAVLGSNCDADAHLIAASPDMLEALKAWQAFAHHVDTCDTCTNGCGEEGVLCNEGTRLWNEANDKGKAAIAKAEGRD